MRRNTLRNFHSHCICKKKNLRRSPVRAIYSHNNAKEQAILSPWTRSSTALTLTPISSRVAAQRPSWARIQTSGCSWIQISSKWIRDCQGRAVLISRSGTRAVGTVATQGVQSSLRITEAQTGTANRASMHNASACLMCITIRLAEKTYMINPNVQGQGLILYHNEVMPINYPSALSLLGVTADPTQLMKEFCLPPY